MVRSVLIAGLLAAVLSLIGASPASACSPPDEPEPVPSLNPGNAATIDYLDELAAAPGAFALQTEVVAVTSNAPGFYRTGKLAVIRTWGPAGGEFPLWTVGSSRKAIDDDDCLFGNDAPSKGTIRIWLRSGGDSFPLAGQGVISYLDTAFGPGVDQRVDIEAAEAEIAALDAERAPPLFPESSGRRIVIGSVVSVLIAAGVIWRKRRVDPGVA